MKKKILVGLLVFTGVAVLTAGVYATWLMTPPGMPDSADEAASVITSARFARLPIERKEAYLARMRELIGQMSDEERRAFFEANRDNRELREATREVFQAMALEQARSFASADPSIRISMLDDTIDNMGQLRQGFGRGGGFGGRGPGGGPGGDGRRGPGDGEGQPQATNENGEPTEQPPQRRLRPEEMTPEQLAELQQQRQERINERMNEMQEEAATGNPQDDALMQEYRRALRERMQQRGMDVGRRGGGNRGRG